MKTTALPSLLAAACLTAPALADPALPAGWVAGKPGLHDAREGKPEGATDPAILEARQRATRLARGRAIDVDALPVVAIAKGRPPGEAPAELPPGGPADVVVLKAGGGRRLNVAGFAAGVLTIERTSAFFGLAGAGGIAGACGGGAKGRPLQPIRYEALRRADNEGSIEFVLGRGFVETSTCRVSIEERWSARPAKIAGGLVLGFRTRCDDCAEGSREALHVLTPQLSDLFDRVVPLEHHVLPLEGGASGIVSGFAGTSSGLSFRPPDWSDVSDRGCGQTDAVCSSGVRVEVSRAAGEAKATLIVKPAVDAP
jgi:hypothetical protein